jgi:DNA-binding transcriptional LysR family regulator
MKLRHLHYFLVLSEELNFTRAARHCKVSQPSLSNAIKSLERKLGGRLVNRENRFR